MANVDSILFQYLREVESNPEWRPIYVALEHLYEISRQTRTRVGGDEDSVAAAETKELFSWQGVADKQDAKAVFGLREKKTEGQLPVFFSSQALRPALRRDFFSTSSAHTTAGSEIIEATGAITVTLNATPDNEELVTVKRNTTVGTVTIAGNGKNIDGATDHDLTANYDSRDVIYSSTSGKWLII